MCTAVTVARTPGSSRVPDESGAQVAFREFRCSPAHTVSIQEPVAIGVTEEDPRLLVSCSCRWNPSVYVESGWLRLDRIEALRLIEEHLTACGVDERWVEWARNWQVLYSLGNREVPAQPPHVQCR